MRSLTKYVTASSQLRAAADDLGPSPIQRWFECNRADELFELRERLRQCEVDVFDVTVIGDVIGVGRQLVHEMPSIRSG